MYREIEAVVKSETESIMEEGQICNEKLEQLTEKAFQLLEDRWTRDLGLGILGNLVKKKVLNHKTHALIARKVIGLLENSDGLRNSSLYWSFYVLGEILYDLSLVESSGDAIVN